MRRHWRFQRMAWAFLLLFTVASLAGVFDRGPLAHGQATTGDGLQVSHERITHHGARADIEIFVDKPGLQDGVVRVFLGRELAEGLEIHRTLRLPLRTFAGRDDYGFELGAREGPVKIVIPPR